MGVKLSFLIRCTTSSSATEHYRFILKWFSPICSRVSVTLRKSVDEKSYSNNHKVNAVSINFLISSLCAFLLPVAALAAGSLPA